MTKHFAVMFFVGLAVLCDVGRVVADDIPVLAKLRHDDDLDGSVAEVAITRDGAMLAAAYNVVEGKRAAISKQSGQGGTIVGQVVLWDVARRAKVGSIACGGNVEHVAFSPDGKLLAVAHSGENGKHRLRVVDATSRKDRHSFVLGEGSQDLCLVSSLAFSPDGGRLLVGTFGYPKGGGLTSFDMTTGEKRDALQGGKSSVSSLSFTKDGNQMVSISEDEVQIRDAASLEVRKRFPVGRGNMAAIAPDGNTIAVSTTASRKYGGVVALWLLDARTGEKRVDCQCDTTGTEVLFTPDGKRLIYGYGNGIIAVFDVATGRRVAAVDGPTFTSLALTRKGDVLASGNQSETVWLWDVSGVTGGKK